MKRVFILSMLFGLLATWPPAASSQELKPFLPEFHGYATQSLIYSNQNNWNTTNSTSGSLAWTEAVLNANSFPTTRLRLGAQVRYFRLGDYGNNVTFDWAAAEYKVNEHFGFRVGKVKTPIGLLNETQDIDPAHLWILLPQSLYPLASRTAYLAQYGGIVFGTVPLRRFGKLDYRSAVGDRSVPAGDGFFDSLKSSGITVPGGVTGLTFGGALRWSTPVRGLMVGSCLGREQPHGALALGPYKGTLTTLPFAPPSFFAHYEHRRLMIAGEYRRFAATSVLQLPPLPLIAKSEDNRGFYVMASYKLAQKLTGGAYFSSDFNRKAPLGPDRYQKDWTIAARYDVNPYLYLKAEEHFVDGTHVGFSASNNPNGLVPTSTLSLLKLGVTF